MSRAEDREELFRLRSWKADAMKVLARWDDVAAKVDIPLGEFKSEAVGREIDRLQARVAELEAIPPHPYYLPWVKLDPTTTAVLVKTADGWVHIGPEPPVPDPPGEDWIKATLKHFDDIGPLDRLDPPGGTP